MAMAAFGLAFSPAPSTPRPPPPLASCTASLSFRPLLRHAPSHCSSCRFLGVLSISSPRPVSRNAILALDPDFYKIPHVEGIPVGKRLKLFNLPPDDDREQLRDELIQWYESIDLTVESLEFTDDPELNAAGVGGFVELSTRMEACMAIARLDGSKFKGRYVRMDFVERRPHEREIGGRRNRPSFASSSYSDGGSGPSSNSIYVGNLAWTTDENGLESLFSPHGTVQDVKVMRDRETGRSRGFGFVVMSTAEEMQAAIAAVNGQLLEGRSLRVSVAGAR